MKPLGVVIPTRNSAAWLPRHLDAMQEWMDLADEVVVVDSESTDDTLAILKTRLVDARVQWLRHPPGLYASWNHGIAALGTKWAYIATVGDTINRSGIERLLQAAEGLDADVMCSSPRWVNPDGSVMPNSSTPIREMASELGLPGPAVLMPVMLVAYCAIYALARGMNTPLCSSASNLYRTSVLTQHPFPVDFGSAGDAFWLLRNATTIRYGLLPEALADYLAHPVQHGSLDLATWQSRFREAAHISESNANELRRKVFVSDAESDLLRDLLQSLSGLYETELALERMRQGPQGNIWVLRPGAWLARQKRNRARRDAHESRHRFVNHLLTARRAFTRES